MFTIPSSDALWTQHHRVHAISDYLVVHQPARAHETIIDTEVSISQHMKTMQSQLSEMNDAMLRMQQNMEEMRLLQVRFCRICFGVLFLFSFHSFSHDLQNATTKNRIAATITRPASLPSRR
jgi:hypothetical protein